MLFLKNKILLFGYILTQFWYWINLKLFAEIKKKIINDFQSLRVKETLDEALKVNV